MTFLRRVLWFAYLPIWVPIVAFVYVAAFTMELRGMAVDWWAMRPWVTRG